MREKYWTRKRIGEKIQELWQKGSILSTSYLADHGYRGMVVAAFREFKKWKRALKYAGLNELEIVAAMKNKKSNKAMVIQEILKLRKDRLPLDSTAARKFHSTLYGRAQIHFGGWRQAIEAAGLDYLEICLNRPPNFLTREKIVEEIIERAEKKLSLNAEAVGIEDGGLYQAALLRFGKDGWHKAIRKAGLPIPTDPRRKWTRETIVAEIRKLEKQGPIYGHFLCKNGRWGFFSSAIDVFGSWGEAVEAAGFNYRLYCKAWHWAKWLRSLSSCELKKLEGQAMRLARERRK